MNEQAANELAKALQPLIEERDKLLLQLGEEKAKFKAYYDASVEAGLAFATKLQDANRLIEAVRKWHQEWKCFGNIPLAAVIKLEEILKADLKRNRDVAQEIKEFDVKHFPDSKCEVCGDRASVVIVEEGAPRTVPCPKCVEGRNDPLRG